MHRTRGFTLIELMVTMAIIGILVAASIPSAVDYYTERVSLNASRDVTQQLRGLRHLAATTNRALIVTITEGDGQTGTQAKGTISVIQSSDNRCRTRGGAPQTNLSYNLATFFPGHNVQIVKVAPRSPVRFCIKPDGRVMDMGGNNTNVSKSHGLVPSQASTTDCTGEGYVDQGDSVTWPSHCSQVGMLCLKVAYINESCPDRCARFVGDCQTHLGVDHIITMNFSGEVRMVQ